MIIRIFQILSFVILISFLIFCQSNVSGNIETYTIKKGDFISSVTETGELAAVRSRKISAPNISYRFGQLKISKLVEDGKVVEKGEVLIEFDKTEVQKGIIDVKSELEIAQAELRKALANQASRVEELEADFEKTKIQHKISKLNLEKASY